MAGGRPANAALAEIDIKAKGSEGVEECPKHKAEINRGDGQRDVVYVLPNAVDFMRNVRSRVNDSMDLFANKGHDENKERCGLTLNETAIDRHAVPPIADIILEHNNHGARSK